MASGCVRWIIRLSIVELQIFNIQIIRFTLHTHQFDYVAGLEVVTLPGSKNLEQSNILPRALMFRRRLCEEYLLPAGLLPDVPLEEDLLEFY